MVLVVVVAALAGGLTPRKRYHLHFVRQRHSPMAARLQLWQYTADLPYAPQKKLTTETIQTACVVTEARLSVLSVLDARASHAPATTE